MSVYILEICATNLVLGHCFAHCTVGLKKWWGLYGLSMQEVLGSIPRMRIDKMTEGKRKEKERKKRRKEGEGEEKGKSGRK